MNDLFDIIKILQKINSTQHTIDSFLGVTKLFTLLHPSAQCNDVKKYFKLVLRNQTNELLALIKFFRLVPISDLMTVFTLYIIIIV